MKSLWILGFLPVLVCNSGEPLRLKLVETWEGDHGSVQAVLQSVAGQLLPHVPDAKLPEIEVQPKGGPIVLYQRGPKGEIRVKLDTGGTLWAQHAYQFAHELCHILCRYDNDEHRNKWFEESLCEMASLFALRRMAEAWKTDAPFPNWRDYSKSLFAYADARMTAAKLPPETTLAAWYGERAEAFSKNATQRENNTVIATAILPLFEAKPENWEAVWYLNVEKHTPAHTFADYLRAWRKNAPENRRAIVNEIAKRLGVEL